MQAKQSAPKVKSGNKEGQGPRQKEKTNDEQKANHMNQSRNYLLTASKTKSAYSNWVLDLGARNHMTGNKEMIKDLKTKDKLGKVMVASSNQFEIAGVGSVELKGEEGTVTTAGASYIPELRVNLISIFAPTQAQEPTPEQEPMLEQEPKPPTPEQEPTPKHEPTPELEPMQEQELEPTVPEPTMLEPMMPEPTVPEPTVPEPTMPEPMMPEPTQEPDRSKSQSRQCQSQFKYKSQRKSQSRSRSQSQNRRCQNKCQNKGPVPEQEPKQCREPEREPMQGREPEPKQDQEPEPKQEPALKQESKQEPAPTEKPDTEVTKNEPSELPSDSNTNKPERTTRQMVPRETQQEQQSMTQGVELENEDQDHDQKPDSKSVSPTPLQEEQAQPTRSKATVLDHAIPKGKIAANHIESSVDQADIMESRRPRATYAFSAATKDPKSTTEAIERDNAARWKDAILDELKLLVEDKTSEGIDLREQPTKNEAKSVDKGKQDNTKKLVVDKLQLVIRGFTQVEGVETFTPVIMQMDIVIAYLLSKMYSNIGIQILDGYELLDQQTDRKKQALKQEGSDATRQSSDLWNKEFNRKSASNLGLFRIQRRGSKLQITLQEKDALIMMEKEDLDRGTHRVSSHSVFIRGKIVSWRSWKQDTVAMLSMEAVADTEVIWKRGLLTKSGCFRCQDHCLGRQPSSHNIKQRCDCQNRTRYKGNYQGMEDQVSVHPKQKDQKADGLTKAKDQATEQFRAWMGMEASVAGAQAVFHAPHFRVYDSGDVIGVEVAGAMKNVIALAAGACAGLGYQQNARAAIITRGLAEIMRIGVKLGADPLTFSGLAGVGDLFLTAQSEKSRNYTVGFRLGKGEKLDHVIATLGSVAEGVETTKAAYALCRKIGVESPLCDAVYSVLFGGVEVHEAVRNLMGRDPHDEFYGIVA
ncbi:hypothetical protein HDU80_007991 [Chytriomyces hyalinus]|nr:hypothetical protein HDU80_007991 [Chytriomyces hyalinus]